MEPVTPSSNDDDPMTVAGEDPLRRLQRIVREASALPDRERAAFLEQACAGEPGLRARIDQLLVSDAPDDDATIAARAVPVAEALAGNTMHGHQGQRIGGYRLIEEIGSGGMGTVFLAERDDRDFRHVVAIKLVRGFPTAPVIERFRRERELLATLRHPNIARLFDGGTTPGGQPYLVMEHIDGVPLDAWVRTSKPSLTQRLRLFQSLCSAVQHAHQQLIVHRDLKPANVLVRADGEPVLLDFGIGTLLDERGVAEATQFNAMTPAYASPEQLVGAPITTLSDIFGLGLILFELLAGVSLRKPQGNTTHLIASRAAAAGESWLRGDARAVRGDLDNIVRKALREEPERRYQTAMEFSRDIDSWFDGKPVNAAPDSLMYRTRKFVARHPVALGATLSTIVVLALLSVRLAAERDRAIDAQARARIEAEGANQSAVFLVDLFKAASPESTRGDALTVRALVDQAQIELEGREFSRPEVKVRLETALGEIYHSLGLPQQSIDLLERAIVRLRSQGDQADTAVLARALTQLARAYSQSERNDDALRVAREALPLGRAAYPVGHPDMGATLQTLGVAEEDANNVDAARSHFEEAEQLFAAAGPDFRGHHAATLHNLGWAASRRGDNDEARQILSRALSIKLDVNGRLHPSTFHTVNVLAVVDARMGDLDSAIQRLTGLLADQIELLGEPNTRVAATHNELGSNLQDAGRFAEAALHYRRAIAQHDALGGTASADRAVSINNYATLLEDTESFEEAEAHYRRALAMRESGGAAPQAIARGQHNLARLLLSMGRIGEARTQADASWSVRRLLTPAHHGERLDSLLLQARIASADRGMASAAPFLAAYRQAAAAVELAPAQRGRQLDVEASLAADAGDRAQEIALRRTLVDLDRSRLPATHPLAARQSLRLAAALHLGTAADQAEAARLVEQARAPLEATLAQGGPSRILLASLSDPVGQ